MSTRTSEFLSGLVVQTVPRRGGRPPRDFRLEHAAGAQLTVEAISQGAAGYAGDDEDPRPVRPRSLYDVKKWIADYFPLGRFRGALPEATLYFAFVNDRVSMKLEEAVPVPLEDLWWLAAPGDTLLLSDWSTSHYISVYHVDMDANRIDLLDPWPDRVFLKKGLNEKGVEATIEPSAAEGSALGRRISITRDEFLQVAVGLITKDTPELIEHYLAYRPAGCDKYQTRLAFGLTLMDAEEYVLARYAAEHFRAALRLAESEHRIESAQYAAARLYVALLAAVYHQGWSGDPLAAKPFEDDMRHLTAHYPEEGLLAGARAPELCSLSNAAGASKDFANACQLLDVAVTRFPDEEEPRRLRAKVRVTQEDHQGALDDTIEALALNARRIRAVEERRDTWHPKDRFSRSDEEARIAGLKSRRLDELDMQATALIALRRLSDARTVAENLIAHAPDSPAGYAKLAGIEELLGNHAAALSSLRQAREREKDTRKRAQMDALLHSKMAPASLPEVQASGKTPMNEDAN